MKLHLVALPHTRVEPASCGCAYTAKILKFCRMMAANHEIFLYAPEGPDVPGVTLVPCLTELQRVGIFGADDANRLPIWPNDDQTLQFNLNVTAALNARAEPRDLVLLTGGWMHRLIKDTLPKLLHIEPGVGYEGILTDYCAFESYAWMHTVYAKKGINDIRWFDCVIPPYCDAAEFPTLNTGKGEYLLFLGRLVARKGPQIAAEIAKACKLPLLVAGAGAMVETNTGAIVSPEVRLSGDVKYVGPVGIEERAQLLAGAKALICPTTYVEPGGNVAVEAQLAGTPVISADFGVFSETIIPGRTGFHFRMFREAVMAVNACGDLDPQDIRDLAVSRYSLEAVAPQFDQWFNRLQSLSKKGWYQQ